MKKKRTRDSKGRFAPKLVKTTAKILGVKPEDVVKVIPLPPHLDPPPQILWHDEPSVPEPMPPRVYPEDEDEVEPTHGWVAIFAVLVAVLVFGWFMFHGDKEPAAPDEAPAAEATAEPTDAPTIAPTAIPSAAPAATVTPEPDDDQGGY